jgi:hypothetical protein
MFMLFCRQAKLFAQIRDETSRRDVYVEKTEGVVVRYSSAGGRSGRAPTYLLR